MTGARLPRRLEEVVREVLDASGLELPDRADVERDLRAHFEDGLAAGVTDAELASRFGDPGVAGRRIARARRDARARTGTDGRWWMSPREWWSEVRRAARRLARAPGFAAIVILTLALGVGANTAVFTVLDAVLLEDLPYAEPDRLVRVYESNLEYRSNDGFLRAPVVAEIRTWDEVFEDFGSLYTYREVGADLTDGDQPRRVTMVRVSSGYFETLGVAPVRGRVFTEEESFGPGEAASSSSPIVPVAVISAGLWARHYDADPDIVGRTIQMDGAAFEVVGVMPPGFNNPFGSEADVWVPQDLRAGGSNSFGNFYLSAVGRLQPGVSVEAAQERLGTLAAAWAEEQPDLDGWFPRIVPLQADVVGATRQTMLWILAGAAGLVLLTACVNVANLLFARGLGRDRDLALRSALGSGRARLVASILTENGLLAAAGGLVGLALGWGGLRALLRLAPDALPMSADIEVGGSVFLFALAMTGGALLVFGLTPALRLSRTAPAEVLRSGDRSATVGRARKRLRDGLVIVQVAAALVLVAGATLLTRSFNTLLDVPLGVEAAGVLTFEVHLPNARYPDGEARYRFHEELHDRIAGLPGVASVGATSWLPVSGRYHTWGFYWDPENPDGSNDDAWNPTDVRVVTGDYFGTVGIEVLRGEDPEDVDLEAEQAAWVNQTVVEEVFEGGDALGEQIWLAGGVRRIKGIVEDIPHDARGQLSPTSYVPHAQFADNRNWSLTQAVRAQSDLTELREQIRGELAAMDAQLVLYRPRTFQGVLDQVRAQDRFATVLMAAFAVLALVLSLVGTYGVLAGTVAGRTREIGIRMALGADQGSVRGIVLRHAFSLTIPGILVGLIVAFFASSWLEALLFDVRAGDPAAYGLAALAFLLVTAVAGWVPARRATRVDPARTLAQE